LENALSREIARRRRDQESVPRWEMSDDTSNPFDPKNLAFPSDLWAVTPAKIKKRRQHFAMLPMTWYERLKGADGQTYRVAWFLLYQHWKNNGDPIKLANGMLAMDGVPSESKRRALRDLERRGLITVERWPKKSPVVRLMA
jgi:hypothetical protein